MAVLSVCVPTYGRPDMIDRLLDNLRHQTRLPHEILIVDASPDSRTQAVVEKWQPDYPPGVLHWITSEPGLTLQRNVGIDHSNCELMCMLDDDMLLENDCLEIMADFLDSPAGQEFGGVNAYFTNDYGADPDRHMRFYQRIGLFETLEPGRWLYCGEFTQLNLLKPFEGIYPTDFLQGGGVVYRKSVLEDIRPDSSFRFGGEDKHLSLRVAQLHKVGVLGHAHMIHDMVAGGARRPPFRQRIRSIRNRAIILVECDPRLSIRRYLTYLIYQAIDLMRKTVSIIPRGRWDLIGYISGEWVGWWWNLLAPPRRRPQS